MIGNAPVALFVYNRPEHTRKTVEALKKNLLASASDLYVFSDAAKDRSSIANVEKVRSYIREIAGFNSITIVEREENAGLATSIIDGVTSLCEKHGAAIVLEDDLVTSPFFLKFMNDALRSYENKKQVWHISGWNYPIDSNCIPEAFFWRAMNCWGWATWANRWREFEKNPHRLINIFDKQMIFRFNIDGTADFWDQIVGNTTGRLNTWAIFWYATIFLNQGLCLNPSRTLVKNIGFDGTGQNSGSKDVYSSPIEEKMVDFFPMDFIESDLALEMIKNFYKSKERSFAFRVLKRIVRKFY